MIEQTGLPPNLDSFLLKSVAAYSDRVLINYFEEGRQLTYAELASLTDVMAAALAGAGVRRGDRVGAVMRSIPEFPATMFAVARIGAVIVPINFNYTASEFDFVAEDAGISALVIASEFCRNLNGARTMQSLGSEHVIVVGGGADDIDVGLGRRTNAQAGSNSFSTSELDDPISMQYTSGTTGLPKGCVLTQRYWLEAMLATTGVMGPRYRILEDMPWFYMSGPISLLQAMADGGTVFIPKGPSLSRFLAWLHDYRIDFCWFPRRLLNQPVSPLDKSHALKVAWMSDTTPAMLAAVKDRFGVIGRECYGMTEIGVASVVPPDDDDLSASGSIGVPAPFREMKVVGIDGKEVDRGEVGELCTRGLGILKEYHNRPEANAESFLPGGWFRTGDLAQIDSAGSVFYVGRIKDMIRRSGENISAAEIEQVIAAMPEVLQVAVLAVPDDARGEEVKAYIVLREGNSVETVPPGLIYEWCSRSLAKFKIPRYIEYRTELPMTPSDKVAKGELKKEKPDLRSDSFDRQVGSWK